MIPLNQEHREAAVAQFVAHMQQIQRDYEDFQKRSRRRERIFDLLVIIALGIAVAPVAALGWLMVWRAL